MVHFANMNEVTLFAVNELARNLKETQNALLQANTPANDRASALMPATPKPDVLSEWDGEFPATRSGTIADLKRQLEDVRNKNTALEVQNRELRERLKGLDNKIHPWDQYYGSSAKNPLDLSANQLVDKLEAELNDARDQLAAIRQIAAR